MAMSDISEEIIRYHILPQLPVKSILRFKSVCKDWYAFINSSSFINIHLNYACEKSHDSSDFVIFSTDYTKVDPRIYFYTYYDNAPQFTSGIDIKFNLSYDDECYPTYVVGSCNGLICIRLNRDISFILCNPITRECHRVIDPILYKDRSPPHMAMHGFGYDFVSKNYKIVRITYLNSNNIVESYSTNTNSWTKREYQLSRFLVFGNSGVVLNNKLHWTAENLSHNKTKTTIVVTFDLHTEEFGGEITCPNELTGHDNRWITLIVASGRLCFVERHTYSNNLTTWVMKEYGVSESWTKLYKIEDGQFCTSTRISVITHQRLRDESYEVLIRYVDRKTDELAWYNVKSKSIKIINVRASNNNKIYERPWECYVFICIPSFAPIFRNTIVAPK